MKTDSKEYPGKMTIINVGNKKFNWLKLLPYLIILMLIGSTAFYVHKSQNLKADLVSETNLSSALLDTVTTYKNKNGQLVSEKRTLQTEVSNLEEINGFLTETQKELVKNINELEKRYTIIAAALIKTRVELDSIRDGMVVVDTTENTITISDSLPDIQYVFIVKKVRPLSVYEKPEFSIRKLNLPNTQFIEFHWRNNKKEGYPVSFSVSNSNKYFKTVDIDSYIIPEVKKSTLKPTFWQKLGKTGKKSIPYFIGGAVGAGITLIMTNN